VYGVRSESSAPGVQAIAFAPTHKPRDFGQPQRDGHGVPTDAENAAIEEAAKALHLAVLLGDTVTADLTQLAAARCATRRLATVAPRRKPHEQLTHGNRLTGARRCGHCLSAENARVYNVRCTTGYDLWREAFEAQGYHITGPPLAHCSSQNMSGQTSTEQP
jgi:hypothetical protein